MDRHQLTRFHIHQNENTGDHLLLISGDKRYKRIVTRAFPELYFSRTFEDQYGRFDWGTYIRGADDSNRDRIEALCTLFREIIFIVDDLDESFCLGFHSQMSIGGPKRTELGDLMRKAKPYDRAWNAGNREIARRLGGMLAAAIQQHPTYARADLLLSVPPSNRDKDFDLPTFLADTVSDKTGIASGVGFVDKVRETQPMKECISIQEKVDNIKDAFKVDPARIAGKSIIIIDDIYQSGFSINELGRCVRSSGASLVLGATVTKTMKDLSEDV